MPYSVLLKSAASGALDKLPAEIKARITRKLAQLSMNPRPDGVEKLGGSTGLFRVRIGSYRVVYQIDDETSRVLVVKVGDRREVYRRL